MVTIMFWGGYARFVVNIKSGITFVASLLKILFVYEYTKYTI